MSNVSKGCGGDSVGSKNLQPIGVASDFGGERAKYGKGKASQGKKCRGNQKDMVGMMDGSSGYCMTSKEYMYVIAARIRV
jgi:hypothetical protein